MEFEWSEVKNLKNRLKHKIGFSAVDDFDWARTVIIDRSRHGDGEARSAGISFLYGKLHTVIFTRRGNKVRIISLRRANKAEEKIYEQTTQICR